MMKNEWNKNEKSDRNGSFSQNVSYDYTPSNSRQLPHLEQETYDDLFIILNMTLFVNILIKFQRFNK